MRDVQTSDEVFDLSFHPSLPIFAAGLITGELLLYRIHCTREPPVTSQPRPPPPSSSAAEDGNGEVEEGEESAASAVSGDEEEEEAVTLHPNFYAPPTLLFQCCPHTSSIRSLSFSHDGRLLYTASSDQSVQLFAFDAARSTLTMVASIPAAHTTAINVLRAFSSLHPDLLATGDDDGYVKVWDTRQFNRGPSTSKSSPPPNKDPKGQRQRKRKSAVTADEAQTAQGGAVCAMTFSESGDYISDLCLADSDTKLLSSSGDGHLQVFDVRRAGKWSQWNRRQHAQFRFCVSRR